MLVRPMQPCRLSLVVSLPPLSLLLSDRVGESHLKLLFPLSAMTGKLPLSLPPSILLSDRSRGSTRATFSQANVCHVLDASLQGQDTDVMSLGCWTLLASLYPCQVLEMNALISRRIFENCQTVLPSSHDVSCGHACLACVFVGAGFLSWSPEPQPARVRAIHRVPQGKDPARTCKIRLSPQAGVWIWIVHSKNTLRVAGKKPPAGRESSPRTEKLSTLSNVSGNLFSRTGFRARKWRPWRSVWANKFPQNWDIWKICNARLEKFERYERFKVLALKTLSMELCIRLCRGFSLRLFTGLLKRVPRRVLLKIH